MGSIHSVGQSWDVVSGVPHEWACACRLTKSEVSACIGIG